MKPGDLVKTLYDWPAGHGRMMSFSGIILKRIEPHGAMKTARITVLTSTGELIITRASYNLLEVVNESR